MANHKSAKKRIRTNERRRVRNKASMSTLKTLTKKLYDPKEKENAEKVKRLRDQLHNKCRSCKNRRRKPNV